MRARSASITVQPGLGVCHHALVSVRSFGATLGTMPRNYKFAPCWAPDPLCPILASPVPPGNLRLAASPALTCPEMAVPNWSAPSTAGHQCAQASQHAPRARPRPRPPPLPGFGRRFVRQRRGPHRCPVREAGRPGRPATDWEFSCDRNGVPTDVLNRSVLAGSRHAYALRGSTPASERTRSFHLFQVFARAFQPARP
jgi:hypothetical protein